MALCPNTDLKGAVALGDIGLQDRCLRNKNQSTIERLMADFVIW